VNYPFNLVKLTCHDFLFYASRDYGSSARPVSIIGNYALMYALNRSVTEVRHVVAGSVPLYDDDLPLMKIYATPAFPAVGGSAGAYPIIGAEIVEFERPSDVSQITWNSTGESMLWAMEREKINLPKVGSYYKINLLGTFFFYTLGEPIPNVVRIGKKFIPARLQLHPLDFIEKSGRFHSACPVNVADLPDDTLILGGSLLTVPPSPLLLNAELDGPYVEGIGKDGTVHHIPVPKRDRFRSSWPKERT
jgi:CRISPR type I-D-associated protein Csc1